MLFLVFGVLVFGQALAEEAPIAASPPPSEADVITSFEHAAPDLFGAWLAPRPVGLRHAELGTIRPALASCGGPYAFFEFVECGDIEPPTRFDLDVKKTDSILYPYQGPLSVPVHVTCTLRRAVPKGMVSWTKERLEAIGGECLGKSFQECTAKAAKPAPKLVGVYCTGGPGFQFEYRSTDVLTFRWSRGKWDFESEAPPPPFPEKGTPLN